MWFNGLNGLVNGYLVSLFGHMADAQLTCDLPDRSRRRHAHPHGGGQRPPSHDRGDQVREGAGIVAMKKTRSSVLPRVIGAKTLRHTAQLMRRTKMCSSFASPFCAMGCFREQDLT